LDPPEPIPGVIEPKKCFLQLFLFGQFKTWLFKEVVLHPKERGGGWDGVENHTECVPVAPALLPSTICATKIIATP